MGRALLVASLGVLAIPRHPLAASEADEMVAFVDAVNLPPKVVDAHARLRTRFAGVLATQGWTIAPTPPSANCEVLARCRDATARYVLRLGGERNQDDGYDFVLQLLDPQSEHPRNISAFCNYCDIDRMGEVAGRFALKLLSDARHPAVSAVPVVAREVPHAQLAAAPTPSPVQAANESHRTLWPAWLLFGGGAAMLGYGAWALHKDGMPVSCNTSTIETTCSHYSSQTIGVIGVTGGAVLALSGLVWVLVASRSSVSQSPDQGALVTGY